MARSFDVRVVSGTTPTSTGTVDFTSPDVVGSSPVGAVVICGVVDGDPGVDADVSLSWGAVDGTLQAVAAVSSEFNVGTSNTQHYDADTACIAAIDPASAALLIEASFDSFVTDGVRLNFTTVDGTARNVIVILFFGSDCDCAVFKQTNLLSGPDTETINVGFEPTFALTAVAYSNFAASVNADAQMFLGVADAAGEKQQSTILLMRDGVSATQTDHIFSSSYLSAAVAFGSPITTGHRTRFVSWSTTGWTIENISTIPSAEAPRIFGLAVRASDRATRHDRGLDTPTSSGDVNVPTGFKPGFVYALASRNTTLGTAQASTYGSIGADDFNGSGGMAFHHTDRDNVATTQCATRFTSNRLVYMYNVLSTIALATAQTANRSGTDYDLSFSEGDATQRKYGLLTVEEAPFEASSDVTLPSITSSGTGLSSNVAANAAVTLPSLQSASTGITLYGSTTVSLPSLSVAATGQQEFRANAAVSLPSIASASEAQLEFQASAAVTLPSLESSATAQLEFQASAAVTLPSLGAALVGETVLAGTAIDATAGVTLPSLQSSSTGNVTFLVFLGIGTGSMLEVAGPSGGSLLTLGICGGTLEVSGAAGGSLTVAGPVGGTLKVLPQWNLEIAIISAASGETLLATGTIDACKRLVQDLCMVRGDDGRSWQFTFVDQDDVAIDFTGASAKLVVDPDSAPPDTTNNLFEIAGVLNVPATDGVITFTPSKPNSLQEPGTYFYDVQVTTSGGKTITVAVGQFTVVADIADAGT